MPLADARDWPLIGRADDLSAVLASLSQAGIGTDHAVLAGAAGVGKTRLSRHVMTALADDGVPGIRVGATAAAQAIPLGAFASVVHGPLPAAGSPLELMMAVSTAVLARGDGAPILLAVDDAHLLDPTSATLVGHLAGTGRVSVLATVRTGAPCHDVIRNLWKDGGARRFELQALSEAEVGALLDRVLGGDVSRSLVVWAYRASEGNPLFLRELIEGAHEDGTLRRVDGLWQVSGAPRPSLRLIDLVDARIGELDEAERRAVELVALGEPLPLSTLEQLVDPERVNWLERRELVRVTLDDGIPGAGVALGHPLYGEVVRRGIGQAAGRTLRRELAAALQQRPSGRGDDDLRRATWLVDAGESPPGDVLLAAAGQAAAALDHALAARLAEAAVGGGHGTSDLAATVQAAGAHRALGDFARAEELLGGYEDAARDAVDRATGLARGYLFTRVATLHWGLGRLDAAGALLDRAETWSDQPAWTFWVRAQRIVALSTGGQLTAAVTEGRRLLAEPHLPASTRLPLAVGHAFAVHQTGRITEALGTIDEAVAEAGPDDTVDWPPDAMAALIAIAGGVDWPRAEQRLTGLRDRSLAAQDVATSGYAELLLGQLALFRGAVDDAIARLAEAEAHLEIQDSRRLLPSCRALRVAAAGMSGTDVARLELWLELRASAPPTPWVGASDVALADIWAAAGTGAYSVGIRRALEFSRRCEQAPLVRTLVLHEAVRIGARPGEVLGDLRAAAQRTDSPLAAARLAHVRALAARDAGALRSAAESFVEVGALLSAAEAATAAAAAYARDGSARAAEASARAAELRAQCPGADTPGLRVAADSAGLTAREREIAALAARGLSNADIAGQLVLSSRTVESHLYRACAKLGVSRREELAGLLG